MTNDKDITYRWLTEAEIDQIVDRAVEAAVRAILAMDPHVYDEDTVRAAAQVVRESIRRP